MIYQELTDELRIYPDRGFFQKMSYDRNKYLLRIENILRAFEHQELADCLAIIRQEIEISRSCHTHEAAFRRGFEHAAHAIHEALCDGKTPSVIGKWLENVSRWREGDLSSQSIPPSILSSPRSVTRQTSQIRPTSNRKQLKNARSRKSR